MDWVHEYVPGQVRASCSVCGCSRRFPDNLTYCIDKLFRCERCIEITALERDMQIQSYRQQPDELESSLSVGLQPQGDTPSTFLADAIEARAAALPGWTPSNTLSDTFTTLPGDVGSSWTTSLAGTATITARSGGGARLNAPTGSATAYVSSMIVPLPTAGRFYSRFVFGVTSLAGASALGVVSSVAGAPSGNRNYVLTLANSPSFSTLIGGTIYATPSPRTYIESLSTIHVGEIWWRTDGYIRIVIDGVTNFVKGPLASEVLSNPIPVVTISASNGTGTLDVLSYVAFT